MLQSPPEGQETSVSMGTPPDVALEVKPRSRSSVFGASGDSGYADSVISVVVEDSEDSWTRQVKRDRDGSDKAGDAEGADEMDADPTKGDSSTEEVEEVENEDEDGEEEQGSKRARVTVMGDEAEQERREVQEELEYHAKAWRLVHLGEGGGIQPRGREDSEGTRGRDDRRPHDIGGLQGGAPHGRGNRERLGVAH